MSVVKDKDLQRILETLHRLAVDPAELEHWTMSIETTAKNMRHDKDSLVEFEYYSEQKQFKFHVKDAKSRDCLLQSIEIHFQLIPESLKAFFSVFKYNLKNLKFSE